MKRTPSQKSRPRKPDCFDPQTADQFSQMVASIVRRLRAGETVKLPGLGQLLPGKKPRFIGEEGPGDGSAQANPSRRESR